MLTSARVGLALTILFCQSAAAQNYENYVGFGQRNLLEKNAEAETNHGNDLEASGFQINFGHTFSPSLTFELNYSRDKFDRVNVGSDDLTRRGIRADLDLETESYGVSFIFPIGGNARITPYFRLGLLERKGSVEATYSGSINSTVSLDNMLGSQSGTWWGFGGKIKRSENFTVKIEAAQFAAETTGFIIGPQFHF